MRLKTVDFHSVPFGRAVRSTRYLLPSLTQLQLTCDLHSGPEPCTLNLTPDRALTIYPKPYTF
jgi:hypothetical protein